MALAPHSESEAGSEDGDEPGSGTAGDPGELDDEPGAPDDEPDEPDAPGDQPGPARRRPARPRRRTLLIAGSVVAAAGALAWAVVASSATRLPGQEITGAGLEPQALAQSLQQAQQAVDRGDDLTAVKDYQKILDRDPNQTEALTGEGWLLAQTQQPGLLQQGLTMLQHAEQADPTYAPAHVYRGITSAERRRLQRRHR